jgi:hypothetical protein
MERCKDAKEKILDVVTLIYKDFAFRSSRSSSIGSSVDFNGFQFVL